MSSGQVDSQVLQPTQSKSHTSEATGISTIPVEILLLISNRLTLSRIARLSLTCRGLYSSLRSTVYKEDARKNDQFALWFACAYGRVDILKCILDFATHDLNRYFDKHHSIRRYNFATRKGQNPLTVAVQRGNYRVVGELLRNGASPHLPEGVPMNPSGLCWFPVNWAMTITKDVHWAKTIGMLVKANVDINQEPVLPSLHQDGEPNPARMDNTRLSREIALRYCWFTESAPIFQQLTFGPPKPSREQKNRPTTGEEFNEDFTALLNQRVKRLKHLLSLGANANLRHQETGQTPSFYLLDQLSKWAPSFYYQVEMALPREIDEQKALVTRSAIASLRELRNHGADINAKCLREELGQSDTVSVLHIACGLFSKHESGKAAVDWLIRNGADVNAVSNSSYTPLSMLCRITPKNGGGIEELIKMGANVNHQDMNGETPLHSLWCPYVDWTTQQPILELLLRHGANPSIRDTIGRTPLFNYLLNPPSKIGILEKIIEKGASPKDRDANGRTPLHEICSASFVTSDYRIKIVKLLHRHGVDVSAKDNGGRTAGDCAMDRGEQQVVSFLEKAAKGFPKGNEGDQNKTQSRRQRQRQRQRGAGQLDIESK